MINDKKFSQTLFNHIMSVWIIPEIKRRQEKKLIPKPYALWLIQIVFYPPPSTQKRKIRLNEEATDYVKLGVILKNRKTIKEGEQFKLSEIKEIKAIKLIKDDPNAGHISLINIEGVWNIFFDFRYNKEKAKKYLVVAEQFIKLSHYAYKNKYLNAFVDVSYSAAELIAYAELLITPTEKIIKTKKHPIIRSDFSRWADLGNTKIDYKYALNKLSEFKLAGRYLRSELKISEEEAKTFLDIIKDMRKYVEELIKS